MRNTGHYQQTFRNWKGMKVFGTAIFLSLFAAHHTAFISSAWGNDPAGSGKKTKVQIAKGKSKKAGESKMQEAKDKRRKQLNAVFETSMGKIVCKLFSKETPVTVENFVGLAQGTKEWTDPKTGEKMKKPFYDGLIFHRVIPKFMIQGGCPLGAGTSGPGYQFKDEIVSTLKFDRPGLLAMANAGPGTNGSQFFITHIATTWLTGRHTIFGEVIEGQDVVIAIGNVEKGHGDKPVTPVIIKKLTIVEAE